MNPSAKRHSNAAFLFEGKFFDSEMEHTVRVEKADLDGHYIALVDNFYLCILHRDDKLLWMENGSHTVRARRIRRLIDKYLS